ncbi:hypothetical protein BCR44DRAFT_362163 [Catenaria anguillulae PL171]|uniref:Uncharacterized protein n=1 Tax=Catenaria anguillulae PL171 TaxID=765915 RepID=A0A1Y2HHR7_9FUNG|nr:hypothetical protein BCR44DRAFT_362163 [Catenaria anguillulae PL171]
MFDRHRLLSARVVAITASLLALWIHWPLPTRAPWSSTREPELSSNLPNWGSVCSQGYRSRQSFSTLTSSARLDFVEAFLSMKQSGFLDQLVVKHLSVPPSLFLVSSSTPSHALRIRNGVAQLVQRSTVRDSLLGPFGKRP